MNSNTAILDHNKNLSVDNTAELAASLQKAFSEVFPYIKEIESIITSKLNSEAAILNEISLYLLNLGGKRVRPILALLSYKLLSKEHPTKEIFEAAAGIELIHMATLLHDDIIDKSTKRRNKESAYVKYGYTPTLLAGDFLLVKAFGLCSHLGEFIIDSTERACVFLTEGEVLEGTISEEYLPKLDSYYDIIYRKTASLFELSTSVGAYCAHVDNSIIENMKLFGKHAGICFQIIDDILDIVADENLLGKPSGTDLKQKTPSLINVLWLNSKDPEAINFFKKNEITKEEADAASRHIKENTKIISDARIIATEYAAKAKAALNSISEAKINTQIKEHLISILEYTLHRCL
ncbi:MAG: polyprenyl synthetase family protein [Proteobacteria bacterium]|nr:polyprenyl synthetase family protein [Pseudomonadota bacterium]